MTQKSYNIQALRGLDISDEQHADDMGIDVPAEVMYTPRYNDYVLNEIYNRNITDLQNVVNPITGHNYTEKEAVKEATKLRAAAADNIKTLMK